MPKSPHDTFSRRGAEFSGVPAYTPYLVIDGHKRIAALRQLGRDTVEPTVWAMSGAEALRLKIPIAPKR